MHLPLGCSPPAGAIASAIYLGAPIETRSSLSKNSAAGITTINVSRRGGLRDLCVPRDVRGDRAVSGGNGCDGLYTIFYNALRLKNTLRNTNRDPTSFDTGSNRFLDWGVVVERVAAVLVAAARCNFPPAVRNL